MPLTPIPYFQFHFTIRTVYLNDYISENALKRLKKHVKIVDNFDHPEEIEAIIVRQHYCTKEMIEKAKNCKLIQMHGVGLDRIDLEAAKKAHIPVSNIHGGNAESVAELTISLILAVSRKLTFINEGIKEGKFQQFGLPITEGNEISNKTLGLVGGGQIAQLVANMMRMAFHAKVNVYDPYLDKKECLKHHFNKVDDLKTLFKTSDIISIHVPFNPSTRHMINSEVLESSKKGLILVNTARGGIVDEKALYHAMKEGKLKGAGMDVFEQQPPQKDNPLFSLDNFIGTMHIGGSTYEALERNGRIVVDHVFKALEITE